MNKLYAALAAAAIAVSGGVALASPAAANQGVYYKNCAEARAAGAAPIRRGEPGYRQALDRDNDGIACETRGGDQRDDRDDRDDEDSKDDKKTEESKTRETTESRETGESSSTTSKRTYGQIGDDDVPVGGVAAGGG